MRHRLSDTLYAGRSQGGVTLYTPIADNKEQADPYAPKMTLSFEEQAELSNYLEDGNCPVCWDEMYVGDVVCDVCLAEAREARSFKEV